MRDLDELFTKQSVFIIGVGVGVLLAWGILLLKITDLVAAV